MEQMSIEWLEGWIDMWLDYYADMEEMRCYHGEKHDGIMEMVEELMPYKNFKEFMDDEIQKGERDPETIIHDFYINSLEEYDKSHTGTAVARMYINCMDLTQGIYEDWSMKLTEEPYE